MTIKTLTIDEVLKIYEVLVEDFADSDDPISPSGVRSLNLLESAIARQQTAIGGILKYSTPVENASTLLYGICNNHPFHNGNKRTALVSMLAHLDKNKLTLRSTPVYSTSQSALYDFMIDVASHTLGEGRNDRRRNSGKARSSDEEIRRIVKWTSRRVGKVTRGEKLVTYKLLEKILKNYGYHFKNPNNNSIDIVRISEERIGIFRRRMEVSKKIGNIPYPGENREVALKHIKRVRKICHLREEDGVDSVSFYNHTEVISSFVNKYRKLLNNLART